MYTNYTQMVIADVEQHPVLGDFSALKTNAVDATPLPINKLIELKLRKSLYILISFNINGYDF